MMDEQIPPQGTGERKKLTMMDAELRDMFAGLAMMGIAAGYVELDDIARDRDKIAETAYLLSAAMVHRRKVNKAAFARQGS